MDHISQQFGSGKGRVMSMEKKLTEPPGDLFDTGSESAESIYQYDNRAENSSKRQYRRCIILLAVLVIVVTGLGLGIGLALRARSHSQVTGTASDMFSPPLQSGAQTSTMRSTLSSFTGYSSTMAYSSQRTSYTAATNSSAFESLKLSSIVPSTSTSTATPASSQPSASRMDNSFTSDFRTSEPPSDTADIHPPASTQATQPPTPTSQTQAYWTQTQVAYSVLKSLSTTSAPTASIVPPRILPPYADLHHGDVTFYTPGLGACGRYNTNADDIVAVSGAAFDAAALAAGNANPNSNPLCGRRIRVFLSEDNGQQSTYVDVTIVDRCEGCGYNDVDLSPGAFGQLAGAAVGRAHGSWYFL